MQQNLIAIDFLRHGELANLTTAYIGQTDVPVSDAGYQAMQRLCINRDYDLIISSPLSRCRLFAENLAVEQTIPMQVDNNLGEIDFGEFEGKTATELLTEQPQAIDNWWQDMIHHHLPKGEKLIDFYQRVVDAFTQQVKALNESQHRLLIVTHGGVIRCLVCYLLDIPLNRLFDFEVGRGTLSQFSVNKNNPKQARLISLATPHNPIDKF